MGGSSANNWDPRNSSLGGYLSNQVGSGPKIDLDPTHSTPGQIPKNLGSAFNSASQGKWGQAGHDLLDAGGNLVQTGLGSTAALALPGVSIGMGQNESDRNKQPDIDRAAAAQAKAQQDSLDQQQGAIQQQQAQKQAGINQQTTANQNAFNQSNTLEDAMRNAYQMRRRSSLGF